jgi:hypothetical protein
MNFDDRVLRDKESYADSLRCTNEAILLLIDQILKEDPDPLIAITADHGTFFSDRLAEHYGSSDRIDPAERLSVLSAWKMPSSCKGLLYDSMSNVNHFRAIRACLTGQEPEYLEDISYWSKSYDDTAHRKNFDPKLLVPIEW